VSVIYTLLDNETVCFAGHEQSRYLTTVDGTLQLEVCPAERYEPGNQGIYRGWRIATSIQDTTKRRGSNMRYLPGMEDCYLDPGYYETARILHDDIRKLRMVGLSGMISDQSQRAFSPHGLGMYVMARTLWDEFSNFDDLCTCGKHGRPGPAERRCPATGAGCL
jgi:hypothetical protein